MIFKCSISVLGVVIASANAGATAFSIGSVDAMGNPPWVPEGPHYGIDITGGSIYQDAFGGAGATAEPNQAFIGLVPSLQWDSYLTIDRGPVEASPGYNGGDVAPATLAPGSTGFTSDSFRGSWSAIPMPLVQAFPVYDEPGTEWQIFLGRITHTGTLTGKLAVSLREDPFLEFTTIAGDIVSPLEAQTGFGLITHDIDGVRLWKNSLNPADGYAFVTKESQVIVNGTTYTVSDIYLQEGYWIPAPGTSGVIALACLGAASRRRYSSLSRSFASTE